MLNEDESDISWLTWVGYHPRYLRWDDQRICWAEVEDPVAIPKGGVLIM